MNTSSAGRRQRKYSLNPATISALQSSYRENVKCPTPRYSAFNIDSVLTPSSSIQSSKPFKFLTFETTKTNTKHRRQPSVLIKDVDQIYNFTNDESFSSGKVSDEECVTRITHHQKNSIFASTTDQKSSAYSSMLKKSYLEEEVNKLDASITGENSMTKPDENFTNLGISINEEARQTPLGILPRRMFCKKCNLETTSVVSLKMPTLPFWRVMCCISSVTDACSDLESMDRYQEYQHKCRNCKLILNS
ncbi:hypothetical protein SteCoe_9868 [Stentor coeruleus]|uniref:LITAF domain-containing protein n=1 Tax=Stentor coeruleus TaxID=5963 RepID=A0A1R2CGQ6_9CILI|nr:hypothetical protein SteCoe_9868 [Stentor coeruleus]